MIFQMLLQLILKAWIDFNDNNLFILKETYAAELTIMVEMGHKVEIEALYCHGFDFLGKYIAGKIVQSDYIWWYYTNLWLPFKFHGIRMHCSFLLLSWMWLNI